MVVADFNRGLIGTISDEARAVPGGRFALLRKCGMTLAVRIAPLKTWQNCCPPRR